MRMMPGSFHGGLGGVGDGKREGAGTGTHVTASVMWEDPNQTEATDSRDARSLMEGDDAGKNAGLALQIQGGRDAKRREGREGGYQRGG